MNARFKTATYMAKKLYDKGKTVLVFLPGKQEIHTTSDKLTEDGVREGHVVKFFRDMGMEELEAAKVHAEGSRIILATSLGEIAVTFTDVDIVIDVGLCRQFEEHEMAFSVRDYIAPKCRNEQRLGRAGRVKRGAYLLIRVLEAKIPEYEAQLPTDAVHRIVAMEQMHEQIRAGDLSLCPIPKAIAEAAQCYLGRLGLDEKQLQEAAIGYPLPLKDAAIVVKATTLGVGMEAAAIVCFGSRAIWKRNKSGMGNFTVPQIVDAMTWDQCCPPGVTRLHPAREAFRLIRKKHNLNRSSLWHNEQWLQEALAVAFLTNPERLVMMPRPCIMGRLLNHVEKNKNAECPYRVTLLVTSDPFRQTLDASLTLPVTPWVKARSNIQLPKDGYKTAKVIGDSTLAGFKNAIWWILRELGYDLKDFSCKGGATEEDVAAMIAGTSNVDLCIAIPNGNRMARQNRAHCNWMHVVTEQIGKVMINGSKNRSARGKCRGCMTVHD